MPRHPKILNRSFAGGVISPEMFGRFDDAHFQAGAAEITNLICKPAGPLLRRPGTQLVRAAKNSTKRVAVLPFKFSETQAFVLEAGRFTVSPAPSKGPTEVGYFRIQDEGATMLYSSLPATYVAEKTPTAINTGTAEIDFGATSHLLNTGDPIVIQPGVDASGDCTFSTATDRVTFSVVGSGVHINEGSQVIFAPGAGTLPTNVEAYRLYYARNVSGDTIQISNEIGGAIIEFATAGTTCKVMVMPWATNLAGTRGLFANTIYYAIRTSATKIAVAASRNDALANLNFNLAKAGTGATAGLPVLKVHFGYVPGDRTNWTGAGAGIFYCIRYPYLGWSGLYVYTLDYLGHPPPDFGQYWVRVSGKSSAVTISTVTHFVDWGAAHGLSNGDPVIFSGSAAPTPIVFGTVYYVRAKTANTFRVSATPAGPLIAFSSAGTSVVVLANSFIEIPHYYSEDELFELTHAQSNDVMSLASKRRPFAEFRRLAAETFLLQNVTFEPAIAPPTNVIPNTIYGGEGFELTVADAAANPDRFSTITPHEFAKGEPVYVTGLSARGIQDGFYVIHNNTASGGTDVFLRNATTGASVNSATAGADVGSIRQSSLSVELINYYVVTSIDTNGVESFASNVCAVTNNLYVPGAFTIISWDARIGAIRYRVYKAESGIFGLIGEATGTSFKDDNIGPDLAITIPIGDGSLFKTARVTFDTANELVNWTAHGLTVGAPVLFGSNDTLPSPLVEGTTYYVMNPSADAFSLSSTEDLSSPVVLSGGAGQHHAVAGFFPGAVAYFEQRRVFGGAISRPQDIWMTVSGTESDLTYSLPIVDSDRVQFRISSRELSQVRHVVPLSHLALLTSSTEYRVTPINDDAITPTSISVRPQSFIGASSVQPSVVNSSIVFASNRGGHVREMGYDQSVNGYITGDLSIRASHLFDDRSIVQQAYQKAPQPIIWFVSSNGQLLGLTYVPDEQVGAWHTHETDGVFESVAVIPEGDEDRIYVVVKRTINGTPIRYIERMSVQAVNSIADTVYLDCALTYNGADTTSISGMEHLEGKTVKIMADGLVQPSKTVTGGAITLTTAASKVHVGLGMTARLETLPLSMQFEAYGSGRQKNINAVWVRVFESGQFRVGPSTNLLAPSMRPAAGQLLTDLVPVTLPSSWNDDGQIVVEQSDPTPLTIVGMTLEVAAGG